MKTPPLNLILQRIEDGCYTAQDILRCESCKQPFFSLANLSVDEVREYMTELVSKGLAEWRRQGGKTDVARGSPTLLCVPKDLPAGSNYSAPYPPGNCQADDC